jgi:single-strand DNA-binding protein
MNATQITTVGNLTIDPGLRFAPTGKAVANVRIAVNHRIRQGEGWADGEPTFYEVTLWESDAENAAESLRKGDRVLVTGQVHTEAWTDSDGAERIKQVITDAEVGASLRFTTLQIARRPREQQPATG